MINGPISTFSKRHLGSGGYDNEVFHDDEHVAQILTNTLRREGKGEESGPKPGHFPLPTEESIATES
jgi:hypothetical protein